ncbi:MAG: acetylornithine deacetylase [Halobacteriovoraceae bacterium]|nr:acetylornithine deacetylase [Halobacteriovoraceae bacterium]|tara:strand:+ start:3547 stop:4719 length:1173 start_codon:yes stop_codon:yes gene_type:complete
MGIKNDFLWDLSEKLISFDTVSFKSNSQASSYIADILQDLGFKTHIDHYSDHGVKKEQVVAWIGPEVSGGLILSGHMDTVPFENQSGWSKDALKLTLENDKIYGRGTCDMKIFIAHCLAAFKELNLENLKKPLVCVFTSDEEVGCLGANKLTPKLERILGEIPVPKRAVVGEPTEFKMIHSHKGVVQFDVTLRGIAGHSSRPDLGRNAIEMARQVIQLSETFNQKFSMTSTSENREDFPEFPYNHFHLAYINGGQAANMIPNECHLKFSYRTFPNDDPLRLFFEFKQAIEQKLYSDEEYIQIKLNRMTKAMPKCSDHELENVLSALTGSHNHSVAYATDGGEFASHGIQTYICGAGSIQQAHMPDEFIEVEQYERGKEFVTDIIQKLLMA